MATLSLVSADSHVVEPADLWTERTSPAFRERAPRVLRDDDGQDVFVCEGVQLLAPAGMSQAGKPPGHSDRTVETIYPGAYDPHARLGEMAVDGVEAEVLYPSISMRVYGVPDPALKQACFEAYNGWIADYCRPYPERLAGIATVTLENIPGAVAEAKRAQDLGLKGLMVSIAGDDPSLYAGTEFDPFWTTAQELAMPVSLHVVTDRRPVKFDLTWHTLHAVDAMRAITNMVFGGLFHRFPGLRVVSAENDGGWAGYLIERMDYLMKDAARNQARESAIRGSGMPPSAYVRRNVSLTMIYDRTAIEARHWIGTENIMWSNDYPHNGSTWPNSRDLLDGIFQGIPPAERHLISAGNAQRMYGLG